MRSSMVIQLLPISCLWANAIHIADCARKQSKHKQRLIYTADETYTMRYVCEHEIHENKLTITSQHKQHQIQSIINNRHALKNYTRV